MFALPQFVWFPSMIGIVTGTVEWPWLGTFLAGTLIAGLAAASLGLLRESIRETTRRRYAYLAAGDREHSGFVPDEIHREAA